MSSRNLPARLFAIFTFAACLVSATHPLAAQSARKTRNVVVVMIDGMRWQEVFRGADPALLDTLGPESLETPKDRAALARSRYGRTTPADAR